MTIPEQAVAQSERVERVVEGLAKAIRDLECPVQFSPLLMEARRMLSAAQPLVGVQRPEDVARILTLLDETIGFANENAKADPDRRFSAWPAHARNCQKARDAIAALPGQPQEGADAAIIERCAKIADQVAINAERRAASHTNPEAKQSAYDKMQAAQECAASIRHHAASPPAPVAESGWQEIAEAVNALPDPLRKYIAALETECDPAGTIRENFRLRDENAGLRKECERLAAIVAEQRGEP